MKLTCGIDELTAAREKLADEIQIRTERLAMREETTEAEMGIVWASLLALATINDELEARGSI